MPRQLLKTQIHVKANFLIEKWTFLRNSQKSSMDNMQERLRRWLVENFERMGHGSKAKLAAAVPNLTVSAISKILNGEKGKGFQNLDLSLVPEIEQFFGTMAPVSVVPAGRKLVPIRGKAGAGPGGTVLFATGDDNFGEVDAPLGASSESAALQVDGNSMRGLAEDGWLIFYDVVGPPEPYHFGSPCVCWLADGRILVKFLFAGRGRGLYDLESTNAPTLRDVPLLQVALVTNIVPRIPAAKFMRTNPGHPVEDVQIEGAPPERRQPRQRTSKS